MSHDNGVFDNCSGTLADCIDLTGFPSSVVIKRGSGYGYIPSLPMAIVFIALYALATVAHLVQAARKPPRFMLVVAAGGIIEIIGWGGRVWSHYVLFGGGFITQICCLVIAPTFFSAALYMMLGQLIAVINPAASSVTSKRYVCSNDATHPTTLLIVQRLFMFNTIFILGDFVTLVIQACGGGMAAMANTNSKEKTGSNIMLAGIIIQLIIMVIYSSFGLVWWFRSAYHIGQLRPTDKTRVVQLVSGMIIASFAIIIRGENQLLFLLDGIPVSIAIWTLKLFHPSRLLTPIIDEQSGMEIPIGSIKTTGNLEVALESKEGTA